MFIKGKEVIVMNKNLFLSVLVVFVAIICLGVMSVDVFADGDDELGAPGISIASGTGMVAAGTGLATVQPGNITINISDNIKQVLLYWSGKSALSSSGDDTIIIEDIAVTGTLVGTSYNIPAGNHKQTYRADITNLALIGGGGNNLEIKGLNFDKINNGAGILVILDDDTALANIDIRDGADFAYHELPDLLNGTVLQTFSFAATNFDRIAKLSMFFSSVSGINSGDGFRPSSIEVTVGGTTALFSNLLDSSDGEEWDTVNLDIVIPSAASSLSVQAFSRNDLSTDQDPASLNWLAAGLSLLPGDEGACRVTAGGNRKKKLCDSDLRNCAVNGTDTWGGQFGAPPRIDGNWTHHHELSSEDSFLFHSNEMFNVICSDPGQFCKPARFAPNRQIDFMGLGRYNSKKGIFSSLPDGSVCFQVHLEDTGEGGPGSRKKRITEPCTHCPGTPINNAVDCPNCTDYYMIEIYDSPANDGSFCTGNIEYVNGPGVPENCSDTDPQLGGYFTSRGNVQIHPDKNGP